MSLRTLESAIPMDHWCALSWRNRSPSSFAGKDFVKIRSLTFSASINPKCPSWLEAVSLDSQAIDYFDISMRSDATVHIQIRPTRTIQRRGKVVVAGV